MRSIDQRALWIVVVSAALAVGACAGTATPAPGTATPPSAVEATPVATPTPSPTLTPTPSPTPTATPEPPPALVSLLDGLTCSGTWTNETFGSTGSFEIGFDLAASGGTVTLALEGNVFGSAGGRLRIPVSIEGETLRAEGDIGYLGSVTAVVRADGRFEIVLDAPPALGKGATVTVTKLALDGDALTMTVRIEVGGALFATSKVEATCS